MDRVLAGELYRLGDVPELGEAWEKAQAACTRYNTSFSLEDPAGRRDMLRELLGSLGKGASIAPPFHCASGSNIHFGAYAFLNSDCV